MKKQIIVYTALVLAIGLGIYSYQQEPKSELLQKEEEQISGAYEALSFLADRQTYPSGKIPAQAYTKAWQEKQRMASQGSARTETDPWESLGPHNRAGRTLALTFNPQNENTLYAGSASGGLWRSYSAGVGAAAWELVDIEEYPVLGVSCITFMPNDSMTMFIGTGEVYNYEEAGTGAAYRPTRGSFGIGILKTTDGGQTWSKSLDWSMDENHGVWAIRIDHSNHNIMYAATTEGVYKSTDAGATWELKLDVIMGNDLIIHQEDANVLLAACGNLNTAGKGIYKSTDAGETWTQISDNIPNFGGKIQLGAAPSAPNIVYASIGNSLGGDDEASWLLRSEDFGSTWTLQIQTDYSRWQGWFSHDVAVHPTNPNEIIVIGINVWRSTDGGQTLYILTEGGSGDDNAPIEGPDGPPNYVHSDAHDVIYHPTQANVVYIASDGGVHRSLDGGLTYASCNGSYQSVQFYNGFSNSYQNETFCMGGLQDNGSISWNGDKTWTRELGGDGSWSAIDPSNDQIWYVSWQNLNIIRVFEGDDEYIGVPKVGRVSFIAPFVLAPSNPQVIYAASSVVARSSDYGDNWEVNNTPLGAVFAPVLSMDVSSQNENVVYAATAPTSAEAGAVYKTTNGLDWESVTTANLPDRYPMDISVDPTNDDIAYVAYAGFGSGHVYKTIDGGQSWEDISTDLPDVPTNAVVVDPLHPSNVYVGNDIGVFVSIDGGQSWEVYQEGMPSTVMVFDLKISPVNRKLRVATHGNGVYQRDLVEETVSTSAVLAQELDLKVSPNPTADRAQLSFELTKNTKVSALLVDASGKTVQTIQKASVLNGEQQLELSLAHLPKGIYYIQLSIDGQAVTQQLLLQ